MNGPEHISGPIARLFSRGDLPRRLLDRSTGNVIVWSDDDLAYKAPANMYVWPSFVRSQFGTRFFSMELEPVEKTA